MTIKRPPSERSLCGRRAEAGWSLPFGLIFLVIIPAVVILFLWGWKRLWLIPVLLAAVAAFFGVVDRLERGKDRPADAQGPVPQMPADYCPRCQRQAEIVDRGGGIFGLRCPHCGHQEG